MLKPIKALIIFSYLHFAGGGLPQHRNTNSAGNVATVASLLIRYFFATLFTYNLPRLIAVATNKKNLNSVNNSRSKDNQRILYILVFISGVGFIGSVFMAKKEVLLTLMPLGAITLFYSMPIIRNGKRVYKIKGNTLSENICDRFCMVNFDHTFAGYSFHQHIQQKSYILHAIGAFFLHFCHNNSFRYQRHSGRQKEWFKDYSYINK